MQEVKEEKVLEEMVIGKLYKINTKKGVVEKYLSYIDKRTGMHYFVDKENYINDSNIGYMFGARGTMHSTKNVIGIV